nr:uncharacterized protein LOC105318372 [Crassostrea gigas]
MVEDAFSITNENDFNLPNQQYPQRAANRIRQKLRPAEPKDLTFEIDQRFLRDFIQGDVRVENERHIPLATPLQKELRKSAKNLYLDGTFMIIRRPFEQLFSIHGFIQKDDCMKQFPLLFVLMSRRRKRDYVAVFQKICSLLPDLAVEGFVMDFERGWHRRMIGKAGKAKLQFYVLVPLLLKEASQLSIIMWLVDEQQLTRYQRLTYRRIHWTLHERWAEYEERIITTSLFLRRVGQVVAPSVPRPDQ